MKKYIILIVLAIIVSLIPVNVYASTYIQTVNEKSSNVYARNILHYQDKDWGIDYTHIHKFWHKGYTGRGVKVAIIDTGIDYKHPDLKDNFVKGISFIKNKNFTDDNGHGTHVAGIIAGENNNIGFVGIAPRAKLYVVKALDKNGFGTVKNLTKGINWAIKNKVNIINMSIGLSNDEIGDKAFFDLQKAINKAYSKGILIVAASGNDDNSNVDYPARFKNVIAVGAITDYDYINDKTKYMKSDFSNFGNKLEVTAPGEFVYSTYPMKFTPFLYPIHGYEMLSGTSMASPYVAGFLAVLKNKYPNDNVSQLRNHLHRYTKDLGKKGKDNYYGYGSIMVK